MYPEAKYIDLLQSDVFARELGVSAHTSKEYFNMRTDTLIAWYLPLHRHFVDELWAGRLF